MKKSLLNPAKTGLLMVSFMLVCGIASGAVYTAVASGNWSSSATWGGSVPSFNLTSGDQVVIGTGIDVTMDQNVTLNNALAEINVTGTLSAAPHVRLIVVSGVLTGSGSISAAQVILNAAGSLTFTGSIIADTLQNSIVSLNSAAQITVNDELALSGIIDLSVGGSLMLGANSTIDVSGGSLALTGGTLNLTANYSVNYTLFSTITGLELTGAGLGSVTINVGSSNSVTLSTDLVTNDSLKFISGTLMLNGHSLTANAQISGNIMIAGNTSSDLIINTAGGLVDSIMFPTGFQDLNNLTVNVGSGNSVRISSDLTIHGNLVISGSSSLNIDGIHLILAGDLAGTGWLVVNEGTNLAFTASGSITGNVYITGTNLGRFIMDIGSSNTIQLGAGLNVDTLDLRSGILVLAGNNLSIYADIAASGTGDIYSSASSDIAVNASGSLTGSLMFLASGDTVNNLTLNIGGGGALQLGSTLVVNGMLDLVNGYLDLADNMLNIGIAGSVMGANSTAYIITSGTGYLTMYANVGNSTTFNVGTSSNYLPAVLTLNAGSSSGTIGVNVSAGVYSQGTTGINISSSQPMVDATWLFQNNIGSGINANMQLSWAVGAEVNGFVHTGDYISHYLSGWDDIIGDTMTAILSGSLYSVTRANITSMSPFAIFDQQTTPTGINEITNSNPGINIYPNPAYNNLYIKNTGSIGLIYAEIYNALGQVVSTFQFKDDVATIPVYNLTRGNYFIKFYNNDMEIVKKFSKL